MTLNPEHFFDQADKLAPPSIRARQVDLRRAISSTYYGVFHYVLTCLADEVVGPSQRGTPRYALVYRSVEHGKIRSLCADVRKDIVPSKLVPLAPPKGFDPRLRGFGAAALELQELRHQADYELLKRFTIIDVRTAVTVARDAVGAFAATEADSRKAFLTPLLCSPR